MTGAMLFKLDHVLVDSIISSRVGRARLSNSDARARFS